MTAHTIVQLLVAAGVTSIPVSDVAALAAVLRDQKAAAASWRDATVDELMFGVKQ
jgi:hypothetical protein